MRAVIAAGGTAGHINPALAIADEIMKNEPDSEILFIGREGSMEEKLVPAAGYELKTFEIHGFQRRFSLEDILLNIKNIGCVLSLQKNAKRIFKEFKPDVVIGCGGYVSGPVVRKAAKVGIKTAIQEQNAVPGVTTKLLLPLVDIVFAASSEARAAMGQPEKSVVTGNPIRAEFFGADRNVLRERWGIGDKACIVSFGGSLGARAINELAAALMQRHARAGTVFHIHATGGYGTTFLPQYLEQRGVGIENDPNIRVVDYIDDMPECLAAADLVISRAGALTISELEAAGRASALIPSPNVSENHQYYNALTLKDAGAAIIFEEKGIDYDAVADEIMALTNDKTALQQMGKKAHARAICNSAKKIYDELKTLIIA